MLMLRAKQERMCRLVKNIQNTKLPFKTPMVLMRMMNAYEIIDSRQV
jgi:hypothetical protein